LIETLRIIEIIVGVGVLIMVHELGHFLAAKWAGVRVDKFALGLGPRVFAFQRGETEYSLRWIPIGGFCAMAGEEPGAETNAPPERQFRGQPPGKRAVILFAGVFMNFILAILFFSIAFGMGVEFPRPLIGYVQPETPADKAGLLPGDEIIGLEGDMDIDWQQVKITTMMSDAGDNILLTVQRGEKVFNVSVSTVMDEVQEKGMHSGSIGVAFVGESDFVVGAVTKGSAAAEAGIEPGDVLTEINGIDLKKKKFSWDAVQRVLNDAARKDKTVKVRWRSGNAEWPETTLDVKKTKDPLRADLGFAVNPMRQKLRKYSPWQAPIVGLETSWDMVRVIYLSLRAMLTARISPKHAAGPVGIAQISYHIASQGISKFLWWLAFLGANLAVVNLLPIPPFDGGLLLVTLVEKLRGKLISEQWLMRLQLAGWAFVIVLIGLITYNDILRWIGAG